MKNKTITLQEYDLPIVVHEEEEGFITTCPLWQDCYAQEDTIEEIINEISNVASSAFPVLKSNGKKNEDLPFGFKERFLMRDNCYPTARSRFMRESPLSRQKKTEYGR